MDHIKNPDMEADGRNKLINGNMQGMSLDGWCSLHQIVQLRWSDIFRLIFKSNRNIYVSFQFKTRSRPNEALLTSVQITAAINKPSENIFEAEL